MTNKSEDLKKDNMDKEIEYVSVHIAQPYGHRIIIATPENEFENEEVNEIFKVEDSKSDLCAVYKIGFEGWDSFLLLFNINHIQSLTYGMIAHEVNHVVDFIMEAIGQKVDPNNNEYSAYLVEWLVNTVFSHFIERGLMEKLSVESKISRTDDE
jgi:hypothetical protein